MRSIALGLFLIASMAQAGESPAYGPPDKPAASSEPAPTPWMFCRLTVKRGTVPRSPDVTVYTGLMPLDQDKAKNLDYLTTNKANPSQIQVVKTGWIYQAQ